MGVGQAHWSYEADFVADARSIAAAREFVRGHLLRHRLPYLVEDVRLVVSELATNAIVHAQSPFTVTLAERDWSVLLTVQDGSPDRPVQSAASVLETRGRGTALVSRLSSSWGVTAAVDARHAKSVWASFDAPVRASSSAGRLTSVDGTSPRTRGEVIRGSESCLPGVWPSLGGRCALWRHMSALPSMLGRNSGQASRTARPPARRRHQHRRADRKVSPTMTTATAMRGGRVSQCRARRKRDLFRCDIRTGAERRWPSTDLLGGHALGTTGPVSMTKGTSGPAYLVVSRWRVRT